MCCMLGPLCPHVQRYASLSMSPYPIKAAVRRWRVQLSRENLCHGGHDGGEGGRRQRRFEVNLA